MTDIEEGNESFMQRDKSSHSNSKAGLKGVNESVIFCPPKKYHVIIITDVEPKIPEKKIAAIFFLNGNMWTKKPHAFFLALYPGAEGDFPHDTRNDPRVFGSIASQDFMRKCYAAVALTGEKTDNTPGIEGTKLLGKTFTFYGACWVTPGNIETYHDELIELLITLRSIDANSTLFIMPPIRSSEDIERMVRSLPIWTKFVVSRSGERPAK
ncbi:MAG: hypothetical protein ACE5OZ_07415 [Candidatus Heimdallarchaeota archaeon]